jgi:DNA-binding NarL/FixJ family response regulator
MVRVLLAVSHHLLRAALLDYCGTAEMVCGETATVEGLWAQLQQQPWEVLVLDLCLPGQNKLQTVRSVHSRYPHLPIVAISFALDVPTRYWRDAGALGFLAKGNLGSELVHAVKTVSQGGEYFPTGSEEEKPP